MSLIVHQQQASPSGAGKPSGPGKRASKALALVAQLSWAVAASSPPSGASLLRLLPSRNSPKNQKRPPNNKPAPKVIRSLAKIKAATHYCVLDTHDGVFAGLYLPSPIQKQGGKALHSLSLVFLSMLQALAREQRIEGANGLLCLSSSLSNSQMAFVVVEDGHITADAVYDPNLASESISAKLADVRMPVFLDVHTLHDAAHNGEHDVRPLAWDQLYEYAGPQTQLVKIPASPLMTIAVVCAALFVVAAGASYVYQQVVLKPREQMAMRLKAAQSDPTPAYSIAFAGQANKAGWLKSDLINRLSELRSQPVFLAGWSLQAIDCAIDSAEGKPTDTNATSASSGKRGVCTYAWKRAGGTLTDFRAAVDQNRTPIDIGASGVGSLVTNERIEARLSALDTNTLKTTAASQEAYWPFAQRLGNIKDASVSDGEPKRWDGFEPVGVANGALINTVSITISSPLYLARDVLDQMPPDIFIRSFSINPLTTTVQFKGVIYAR